MRNTYMLLLMKLGIASKYHKNNNLIFAVINKKTEHESIHISRTRGSVYRNGT
jgi:hypothetical protein